MFITIYYKNNGKGKIDDNILRFFIKRINNWISDSYNKLM